MCHSVENRGVQMLHGFNVVDTVDGYTVDGCEILRQISGKHPVNYRVLTIQGDAHHLGW